MNFLRSVATRIRVVNRFFALVASWLAVALVLLTVQQVIARYLFGASSVALQELEWHFFGLVFLLSSAHVLAQDEHVRVDIVYGRLSKRLRAVVDLVGLLLLVIPTSMIVLFYSLDFVRAARTYENPRPDDHYVGRWFSEESPGYAALAPIEKLLRRTVLIGESSPDPGGLEGRWLIKSSIPVFALLLALSAFGLVLEKTVCVVTGSAPDTNDCT